MIQSINERIIMGAASTESSNHCRASSLMIVTMLEFAHLSTIIEPPSL